MAARNPGDLADILHHAESVKSTPPIEAKQGADCWYPTGDFHALSSWESIWPAPQEELPFTPGPNHRSEREVTSDTAQFIRVKFVQEWSKRSSHDVEIARTAIINSKRQDPRDLIQLLLVSGPDEPSGIAEIDEFDPATWPKFSTGMRKSIVVDPKCVYAPQVSRTTSRVTPLGDKAAIAWRRGRAHDEYPESITIFGDVIAPARELARVGGELTQSLGLPEFPGTYVLGQNAFVENQLWHGHTIIRVGQPMTGSALEHPDDTTPNLRPYVLVETYVLHGAFNILDSLTGWVLHSHMCIHKKRKIEHSNGGFGSGIHYPIAFLRGLVFTQDLLWEAGPIHVSRVVPWIFYYLYVMIHRGCPLETMGLALVYSSRKLGDPLKIAPYPDDYAAKKPYVTRGKMERAFVLEHEHAVMNDHTSLLEIMSDALKKFFDERSTCVDVITHGIRL